MILLEARLQFLLVALVILIVVYPLIQGMLVLNALLTAVLLAALYAVSQHRRQRVIALLLGVPWCIVLWLYQWDSEHLALAVMGPALGALFLGYVTQVLLRHVIRADRVDAEMIYGGLSP